MKRGQIILFYLDYTEYILTLLKIGEEMTVLSNFEKFFNDHFHSAVFIAHKIVMSHQAAEDIVQDVFIRMLNMDMSKIEAPHRYLYISVRNEAVAYINKVVFRQKESNSAEHLADPLTEKELDDELEYAIRLQKLINAIELLPERSRKVIKLVCLEKYSYQQAADNLGMTLSTVKTHMYRSFKMLRNHMGFFLTAIL